MLWIVPAASAIHLAATYNDEFITLVAFVYGGKERRSVRQEASTLHRRQHYAEVKLKPVTNSNKRLCTSYYFVEANYWRTQSIVWLHFHLRATCHNSTILVMFFYIQCDTYSLFLVPAFSQLQQYCSIFMTFCTVFIFILCASLHSSEIDCGVTSLVG